MKNLILNTDSYKVSHYTQYPKGTEYVSSYIEARGGRFEDSVFFGLQAFIKEYLNKPISLVNIREAEEVCKAHGVPFNFDGWIYILREYGGFLPLKIQAVPEGTVMGTGNVQVQVVNTDPMVPWLTSYVETALLRAVWYPSTVASLSRKVKGNIYQALVQTSDDPDGQLPFKLHDFGARGATSEEAAMLGGMAHLVNFMGTDTISGIMGARKYYGCDMAGFSIPATEHSTITSWSETGELDAFRNLLEKNPKGLVACVSDSWDIRRAGNYWGKDLKDIIMGREGTLVIRPDSGNPTIMPLLVIEQAMDNFGYKVNSKGFRVLPDQVRVIQGDGMDEHSIPSLLQNAIDRGISVDNFAMGMGGGLLQKVDRDTMKYAMKASAICVDGEWRDVYKDPVTDKGKKSKKGRLALIEDVGAGLRTIREDHLVKYMDPRCNRLRTVFENGKLLIDENFDVVRERARL